MRLSPALFLSLLGVVVAGALAAAPAPQPMPAFPGAEGFGATTPGGRGGRVLLVTNLDDTGPGSFRAACEAEGPRIVVFRVSGTIALKREITVRNPYLTIAGQSAPGDGICVRDNTFAIATHDVVVRYLRSRLGDVTAKESDCIDLLHGARNCVLDHCSATWSIDECLSTSGDVQDCTIQWCLIGESLNASKHKKGHHGYGSLARANGPVTWHHNLWLHNDARNPRLGDNYGRDGKFPRFDVRNNVIYDFGGTASGLTQGTMEVNYVGNYLRPGPSSRARKPITIGDKSDMKFFIRDNVLEGDNTLTADNTQFFQPDSLRSQVHTVDHPFPAAPVTTVAGKDVLALVLASVGASKPARDSVDARLIEHVRARKGKLIDSQTEVGGWPELKSTPPPADTDGDGMSDAWESGHGLNPRDAADARLDRDGDGYTNVEEYLNSLAAAPTTR
jgi:pectate lyase